MQAWAADTKKSRLTALIATLAAAGLVLILLQPALQGPIVSDDETLFVGRSYMERFTLENLKTVLDPRGEPVQLTANWAPVHLLAHMLEFQAFGSPLEKPFPFHVVNGLVHSVNAVLFAALLSMHGVPFAGVFAAGLLFLLHPANAETVAWLSQLKTLLAFSFGFGALLGLPRRPLAATVLFALALLSKPSAAAVLAGAIVFESQRSPGPGDPPRRTRWLFGWGLLVCLYGLPEFHAFLQVGEFRAVLPLPAQLLQAIAIAGRYLVLALTSWGSSAFHQPLAPQSPLDVWFVLGLLTLTGFGAAGVVALVRRHPAAGWLGLAAASYAPIAQIFPFRYSMADRYLYFVLPGLLGAAALALAPWLVSGLDAARAHGWRAAPFSLRAAALGVVLTAGLFALRFHQRAAVWSSPERLVEDAARHYPGSILGQLARARHLVAQGDLEGATAAIAHARDRGHTVPSLLLSDPALEPLLHHAPYMAMLKDMTERWIEEIQTMPEPSFTYLTGLTRAELFLGRVNRARETFARAEALAGESERATVAVLRRELEQMEAFQRRVRGGH